MKDNSTKYLTVIKEFNNRKSKVNQVSEIKIIKLQQIKIASKCNQVMLRPEQAINDLIIYSPKELIQTFAKEVIWKAV